MYGAETVFRFGMTGTRDDIIEAFIIGGQRVPGHEILLWRHGAIF
jgi:hypothetical protein